MKEKLLSTLENSKGYTLAVAQAMPEDHYSFKAVENAWSFGELLGHIAYGIGWWESNFIKMEKVDWAPTTPATSKKEIIAQLEKSYNELQNTIVMSPDVASTVYGFNATLDHITHHRGQAVMMLRMSGIEPPEYTY